MGEYGGKMLIFSRLISYFLVVVCLFCFVYFFLLLFCVMVVAFSSIARILQEGLTNYSAPTLLKNVRRSAFAHKRYIFRSESVHKTQRAETNGAEFFLKSFV